MNHTAGCPTGILGPRCWIVSNTLIGCTLQHGGKIPYQPALLWISINHHESLAMYHKKSSIFWRFSTCQKRKIRGYDGAPPKSKVIPLVCEILCASNPGAAGDEAWANEWEVVILAGKEDIMNSKKYDRFFCIVRICQSGCGNQTIFFLCQSNRINRTMRAWEIDHF